MTIASTRQAAELPVKKLQKQEKSMNTIFSFNNLPKEQESLAGGKGITLAKL